MWKKTEMIHFPFMLLILQHYFKYLWKLEYVQNIYFLQKKSMNGFSCVLRMMVQM